MADQHLYPLHCSVQNYDWGKQGSASLVSELAPAAVGSDFKLNEKECYAELWMGTHPNGPSKLAGTSQPLHTLIAASPRSHLGAAHARAFPGSTHIPFLFKILSMAKALPLQAHPDKKLGEQLNARDSTEFVDDNHKPEIALAIKDGFRGFVGFRPVEQIAGFVEDVPELRQAISDDEACDAFIDSPTRELVKHLFRALLSRPQEEVAPLAASLVKRVEEGGARVFGQGVDEEAEDLAQVVLKMQRDYPGDVGLFAAAFFMNLVTLKRGEAIYIGADEVHAYLEGDIIECMAISDNVVNAAFVPPEERDIKTFTSMLTYSARPASTYALRPQKYAKSSTGRTTRYDPPLEEFDVLWTAFEGAGVEELGQVDGPAIAICVKGDVTLGVKGEKEQVEMQQGSVIYVKSGTPLVLKSNADADVYWAICDA
ncbi:mannose-6-phosphate isomerase [Calocera cornea HHB12733]|uniref:Mannose-6-phosphate isomerase n=1 Tax=Calocera cornea HHB12733 TaxID=1353952 RepID=A0A165F3T7_9BASI|nr:mannose-6-phosphate isomerase [Calocera cornea HHB12733]